MDDFNATTTQGYRTRHLQRKSGENEARINGDCQKFNAIYKHLQRKSGENEADHIEATKESLIRDNNKFILLASLSDSLEYIAESIERCLLAPVIVYLTRNRFDNTSSNASTAVGGSRNSNA
ncbi:hypothetical protein Tco_0910668 [Tanacetum coccineum]|uniref:Uncharacterized protein n=1 Tax=Tanacetum coccineum TaxID=301880 RepID=A0ABQ5CVR9_9ASTR